MAQFFLTISHLAIAWYCPNMLFDHKIFCIFLIFAFCPWSENICCLKKGGRNYFFQGWEVGVGGGGGVGGPKPPLPEEDLQKKSRIHWISQLMLIVSSLPWREKKINRGIILYYYFFFEGVTKNGEGVFFAVQEDENIKNFRNL